MSDREALRQQLEKAMGIDCGMAVFKDRIRFDVEQIMAVLAPLLDVAEAAEAHRQSIRPASEAEDAWFADFISAEKQIAATKAHQRFHQTRADLFDALGRVAAALPDEQR